MKAATIYRVLAGLLVVFGVMHTFGFLTFQPPTAEANAVRDAMTNYHFEIDGARYSYGAFYRGFGLFVTAYLLFSALIAWQLATHPNPTIGWGLCAVQLASAVLGVSYIAAVPAIFSGVVAAGAAWATWQSQTVTRN